MHMKEQFSVFSEIRNNDHLIKYVLENTPMGIALVDHEIYYTTVNSIFARSLGYTVEEIEGMSPVDITSPLFLSRDEFHFSRLVSRELDSYTIKKQVFKRNGEALDICVDVFSYYSENRESVYFIGFYKKCLPFYKEYFAMINTELYQTIKTNSDPGILIADHNGQILFCSCYAASFLGFSVMEINNNTLSEVMKTEHVLLLLNMIPWKIIGNVMGYELEFRHKDGSYIPVISKVFIDDTNYFKNGTLLIIVFDKELIKLTGEQEADRNFWETEILSEVRKLRVSLQLYQNGGRKNEPAGIDINLSNFNLTSRESEILLMLLERKNTKEIAYQLNLAEITIRKHFTRLYEKFGVSCREDLLFKFYGKGIN